MNSAAQVHTPWTRRVRLTRLCAMGLIAFLFVTWLAAVPLFLQGIMTDLDAILAMVFGGAWTPAAVRAAAAEMGMPPSLPAWIWLGTEIALMLTFGAAGLVIFWRKPDGFGTYLAMAFVLIGTRITGPVTFALTAVTPGWAWLWDWLSILAYLAFASLLYLFPDGRFVPCWAPWLSIVVVVYSLYSSLSASSVGIGIVARRLDVVIYLGYFVVGIGAQVHRFLQVSGPSARQQTKWVLGAFVLFIAIALVAWLLAPNIYEMSTPPTPPELAGFSLLYTLLTLANILFVVAVAFAVLRYRLWDVDLIIRRTLIYGVLSALLAVVYLGSVILLQAIFRTVTGQTSPVAVVISTLAIAALFSPLRRRLQSAIDRRFYRRKYDAAQALVRFALVCRDETDLQRLTAELVQVVDDTVQPQGVTIWLAPAQGAGLKEGG